MNELSYLQRLTKLKLETLKARSLKAKFKMLHNIIDIDFIDFFRLEYVG